MGFIEQFLADFEWPEIPNFMHILNLWDYSGQASEVTSFFQQLSPHIANSSKYSSNKFSNS